MTSTKSFQGMKSEEAVVGSARCVELHAEVGVFRVLLRGVGGSDGGARRGEVK